MVTVRLLAAFAVSLAACAAPLDEDVSEGSGAMKGSPAERQGEADLDKTRVYIRGVDEAYDRAGSSAFTELVQGKGLVGSARSEYADVWRQCQGVRGGNRVAAHGWAADVPTSIAEPKLVRRQLFVISTLDGQSRTIAIAIYDEKGDFILGRKYSDWRNDYELDSSFAFNEKLRRCRW